MTVRGGLVTCRPCDLMSPRPWDTHPTLAPASTWNAMGTTLGVGSVMTAAGWKQPVGSVRPRGVGEVTSDVVTIVINGLGLSRWNES